MIEYKPMLAVDCDLTRLRYPVLAFNKYDGVRCYIYKGVAYSRTGKLFPNVNLQAWVSSFTVNVEGELVVNQGKCSSSAVTTIVMAKDKLLGDISFMSFDVYDRTGAYNRSIQQGELVHNEAQLLQLYQETLGQGYEGLILRDPNAVYKKGRSTMVDQGLMRLKPKADAEAIVIGMEALVTKEGITKSLLGALICKGVSGVFKDVEFNIGTGFSAEDRFQLWGWSVEELNAKGLVKFSYMDYGIKDKPRHPVFIGFRSKDDV